MIKTIIFDFGDVFLNLDKQATLKELERHKIADLAEILKEANLQYEKGLLTSEEFINTIKGEYSHLSDEEITTSWNAILLDFPEHRLKFLKELAASKKFNLILLSNTNDIHIDWCRQNIPFFEEFKNCFDAFYLSQKISQRKPDPEIFQFVLQQHQLVPEEVLFIDDTPENTEAAAQLGIHVWNINPATQDVVDLFQVKKQLF